jgi:hypothetical protein
MNLNGLDCKSSIVYYDFDVIVFLTEGRQGLIN